MVKVCVILSLAPDVSRFWESQPFCAWVTESLGVIASNAGKGLHCTIEPLDVERCPFVKDGISATLHWRGEPFALIYQRRDDACNALYVVNPNTVQRPDFAKPCLNVAAVVDELAHLLDAVVQSSTHELERTREALARVRGGLREALSIREV